MTLAQFFAMQRSERAIVLPERESSRARVLARPAIRVGAAGEKGDTGEVRELVRGLAALLKGGKNT